MPASIKLAPNCYYGEKIGERMLAGLGMSECRYLPNQYVESHTHEQAYICLVLRGGYTETTGRQDAICSPLSVVLHPEGERHADRFHGQGAHVFNVEIGKEWAGRIDARTSFLSRRWEGQDTTSTRLMQALYKEFCWNDDVSTLAVEGLMLELAASLHRQAIPAREHRPHQRPPRWLEEVREALDSSFTTTITLAEIAMSADVHPTYLARVFRRYYQCSIGEYVRERRVQFTCTLLRREEIPLSEVAQTAGFADQSHFSRTFKRSIGVTPAQYRHSLLFPSR